MERVHKRQKYHGENSKSTGNTSSRKQAAITNNKRRVCTVSNLSPRHRNLSCCSLVLTRLVTSYDCSTTLLTRRRLGFEWYIAALYFSVNWMVMYEWHGSSNWVSNWALYHILDKMSLLETNCVQSQTAAPLDHHQHWNQRRNSTSTDNKANWCYLGGAS